MVEGKLISQFKCQRCGWCCENTNVNVSYSDIKRWEKQKQWYILAKVSFINFKDPTKQSGFYIIQTLKKNVDGTKGLCPFYIKDPSPRCKIYETRPRACRDFPILRLNAGKCPAHKELVQHG